MRRHLPLAAVALLCALPAPALANPSFTLQQSAEGVPGNLPSKVTHQLSIAAGATAETLRIQTLGRPTISGATIDEQTAVSASVVRCPGRWARPHHALGEPASTTTTLTVAAGATALVQTARSFTQPPWASDTLDATWAVTPAQGMPFDLTSTAPDYRGALGVELGFGVVRVSARVLAVTGTAGSAVDSGRVQLWGYAPGAKRATLLAVARVRDGAWSIAALRLPKAGAWELYARYRTTTKAYADDASECGTLVRLSQASGGNRSSN
ncbi:MAG TPA: hypothetical protein VI300_28975 [Solirubrobacter sp.]